MQKVVKSYFRAGSRSRVGAIVDGPSKMPLRFAPLGKAEAGSAGKQPAEEYPSLRRRDGSWGPGEHDVRPGPHDRYPRGFARRLGFDCRVCPRRKHPAPSPPPCEYRGGDVMPRKSRGTWGQSPQRHHEGGEAAANHAEGRDRPRSSWPDPQKMPPKFRLENRPLVENLPDFPVSRAGKCPELSAKMPRNARSVSC